MKNNAFKKGFTLIELMIVIVILGVLMGTILPRLTGAQSRARDTGRIADLNTLSQALETYYDDNGEYPVADGNCAPSVLGAYLKGNALPIPPSAAQDTIVGGATCSGSYFYKPLTKSGLPNNGYVLGSDVETWQTANVSTNVSPSGTNDKSEYYEQMITLSNVKPTGGVTPIEAAKNDDAKTIYLVVK